MIPTQTYYSDILSGIISGIYSDILTVKTMHISTLVFFPVPWCQIHLDCSLCGCQHSFPVVKAHVRSVRLVGAWGIQLAPELWWKSRDLWTWTGQSLPVTWRRSLRSRWSRAWATGNRAGKSSYYGGQWETYGMEIESFEGPAEGAEVSDSSGWANWSWDSHRSRGDQRAEVENYDIASNVSYDSSNVSWWRTDDRWSYGSWGKFFKW